MQKFWSIVLVFLLFKQISAQSRCSNEPDGRQLPVPNSHNSYILCTGGKEQTRNCPVGQEFNPFDLRCVRAIGTNVRSNPRPGAASPRDRCFNQADGTYLPDPTSRNRFIWCINGEALVGECGTNEIFNEHTSSCEIARQPGRPPAPVQTRAPATTVRSPPGRPMVTTARSQPARPTRPQAPSVPQPSARFNQQPPPRPITLPKFNQRPIVPF